jgi:2-octaprenyl-6-methoxyphenol hydroxylase
MQKSKVSIVGAGIPGLTLALILADHDIDVTVIDKHTLPETKNIKPTARTTALMQGSLEILERVGAWPEFKPQCTPLSTLSIIDDSEYPRGLDNMIRQDFHSHELGLDEFGYNVPLIPMTALLADRARAHDNITILENTNIDEKHEVITQTDLVVGADGRNSAVRTWSGIEATRKEYGQSAITCVISHTQPHDNASTEFHRSGGPCTFVPYGDNKSAVVWVEKTADADAFLKLPRDAFIQALQDRSRDILGQIDLKVEPESWPLMTLKAKRLIAPKTALIAEAAHVLSPIGAQGLNLSLRDVGALVDCVLNADHVGDIQMLKAYARNRRRDMAPRHFGINMLNQMVANDNLIIRGLRRLGLRAMAHVGPIRKILMEQGLAPKN